MGRIGDRVQHLLMGYGQPTSTLAKAKTAHPNLPIYSIFGTASDVHSFWLGLLSSIHSGPASSQDHSIET